VATEFGRVSGNEASRLFGAGVADAGAVARHGYRAMEAGRVVAVPGWLNWLATLGVRVGPREIVRRVVASINAPRR
jgi:hypothetical protein